MTEHEDGSVQPEVKLNSSTDANNLAFRIAEEVCNDRGINATERLKTLNLACRTVHGNNKDVRDNVRMAQQLGLKPSEATRGLSFLSDK